jgi:hypothetical protein
MWVRGIVAAWGCLAVVGASGCGAEGAGPAGASLQVGTGLMLDGAAISVVYGQGPGTAVQGNDARLLAASHAIQSGTEPQNASFAVAGTGQVAGRLTANTEVFLDANTQSVSSSGVAAARAQLRPRGVLGPVFALHRGLRGQAGRARRPRLWHHPRDGGGLSAHVASLQGRLSRGLRRDAVG